MTTENQTPAVETLAAPIAETPKVEATNPTPAPAPATATPPKAKADTTPRAKAKPPATPKPVGTKAPAKGKATATRAKPPATPKTKLGTEPAAKARTFAFAGKSYESRAAFAQSLGVDASLVRRALRKGRKAGAENDAGMIDALRTKREALAKQLASIDVVLKALSAKA